MSIPDPAIRQRRRLGALVQLILIALGVGAVWLNFKGPRTFIPACPTRVVLGVYCPGCGSTRACGRVLVGDFGGAWRNNPALVVIGLPLAGVYLWHLAWMLCAARSAPMPRVPVWTVWALVAVLLIYSIVRNLPGRAFEWARPPDGLAAERS